MPFSADLRAGYFTFDFNMSWFYAYLSDDMNEEIVWKPRPVRTFSSDYEKSTEELCRQRQEDLERRLEKKIEEAVYEYILATSFKFGETEHESVWDATYDAFLTFVREFPTEIRITSTDEEEEAEEEEEPDSP